MKLCTVGKCNAILGNHLNVRTDKSSGTSEQKALKNTMDLLDFKIEQRT